MIKRITERVPAKGKRLMALTVLCMGMFTTTAFAISADYIGGYGHAWLEVTTSNGLKRAKAETVPYVSKGCYYGTITVTTVYEDGSENVSFEKSNFRGNAYYEGVYESAEDYTTFHEFYDYYGNVRLDSCTLNES